MSDAHPCANEPNWELLPSQAWTRPLLGTESTLDQVHQLCDGHDQFAFGFTITTPVALSEFTSRLVDALIRLRFSSPLVASTIEAGHHDHQLRSWVYHPCSSLQEARYWAQSTLRIVIAQNPQEYTNELTSRRLEDTQPPELRNQPFSCHLVTNDAGTPTAVLFYASHALIDGAGALTIFNRFFGWITRNPDPDVLSLIWGEEIRNLPTGPLTSTGGPKKGWDVEGVRMLEEVGTAFTRKEPPHSLKPSRTSIAVPGKAIRTRKVIDASTATSLIQSVKKLGFTVSQLFDAAFILATFRYNPPEDEEKAHVTLYPALINLRGHVQPLYEGHDIDTFLCGCTGGVTIYIPYSEHVAPKEGLTAQMLSMMTSIKSQYRTFLSNPHLVHLESVLRTLFPLREMGPVPNPFWGEVTNLGVIEG